MKGYGSADDPKSPPRGPERAVSPPYATPQHGRPSMPRNESAGGATAQTNESEPLLGEQFANEEGDANNSSRLAIDPQWLSPVADASTIDRADSDADVDPDKTTPTRSGSPHKSSVAKSWTPGLQTPRSIDPRIGLNVNINSSTPSELDTLAYSRDPDESTLLTNDNFTRKYLSSVDEGKTPGLFRRLVEKPDGSDRPYMLVCLGLGVGIAMCSVALLAFVEYSHHHGKAAISGDNITSSSEATWHGVPYAKIGREQFRDPVASIFDVSLFHPSLLNVVPNPGGAAKHASPKPFLKVPFPTGAFWTNLVLLPRPTPTKQRASPQNRHLQTQKNPLQLSYPIVAYPYAYQWSSLGKLQASYSAARRVVQATSIQDAFAPDMTLGSAEDIQIRHVIKFDSLSVTLRFAPGASNSGGASNSFWETYLVQGSPYITAKYSGLTPELTALSDFRDINCPPAVQDQQPLHRRLDTAPQPTASKRLGICDLTEDSTKQNKVITGVQFIVTTKEHLTWLVFASEPITFELNRGARHSIKSRERYGGVIRVALLPPNQSSGGMAMNSTDTSQLASSPGYKRLIYHAGAYPVGGTVSWDFRSGTRNPLATSSSPSTSPSGKGSHRRALRDAQHERRMTGEAPKENNIGKVTFAFDTVHWTSSSPNTNVPLLTLCLPHHAASISSADALLLRKDDFDFTYRSIKGRMVPVVGNSWSYEEELTFMGFGDESLPAKTSIAQSSASTTSTGATSQRPIIHESTAISTLDQSVRDLILQTVESDLKLNLPVLSNGAYGFGKQIARMAQLAHIAEVVDAANVKEVDAVVNRIKSNATNSSHRALAFGSHASPATTGSSDSSGGTARRGYALLEKYLAMWFVGDGSEKMLAYDAQLGGILSKEGMEDLNSDFGNARYNDHHFHYGYVLYAAAILGRANSKFIAQYGPFVDALFYDVAHNSADAKPTDDLAIFFPLARHKSWFDGHSFASGLFPFANGKSQESSSEAVNCYYGAYLWARVRWGGGTDRRMVDFARLLLATEVTGAKAYWHMTPPADSAGGGSNSTTSVTSSAGNGLVPVAYNPAFRSNYMVGNLGMTDVTCTTWFGTENIYVHLINFLPVTAVTAELFDKNFVRGERSVLHDESVEKAWKGYSICNEAILDPNNAWIEAQDLVSVQLDPGLSKSQVLFWVSTREGFAPGTSVEIANVVGDEQSTESDNTLAPKSPSSNTNTTVSKGGGPNALYPLSSCSSHKTCVAENLVGSCCPTTEGVFLRCCS